MGNRLMTLFLAVHARALEDQEQRPKQESRRSQKVAWPDSETVAAVVGAGWPVLAARPASTDGRGSSGPAGALPLLLLVLPATGAGL